jgi:hypothetical protein
VTKDELQAIKDRLGSTLVENYEGQIYEVSQRYRDIGALIAEVERLQRLLEEEAPGVPLTEIYK